MKKKDKKITKRVKKVIKVGEWSCGNCEHVNKNLNSYCVICGKFKLEAIITRWVFVFLLLISLYLFIPWITDRFSNYNSTEEFIKTIIVAFLSVLPIFGLIFAVINFIMEFFKSGELKKDPNWTKHCDPKIRLNSIKNIDDPKVLEHIIKHDEDDDVRAEAVKLIKNQELLEDITRDDLSDKVRKVSIKKLKNENTLFSLIKMENSVEVREEGIKSLKNSGYLIDILKTDSSPLIRKQILLRVMKNDVLSDVALHDPDPEIRIEAIKRVTDRNVLRNIAENDGNSEVEKVALSKLSNPHDVKEVLRNREKKPINKLIARLNVDMDLNYLKRELRDLLKYRNESWFKEGYIDFLMGIISLPETLGRSKLMLSALEVFGTFNRDTHIEMLIEDIIKGDQSIFNRYIEKKKEPLRGFPDDARDLIRNNYTGLYKISN